MKYRSALLLSLIAINTLPALADSAVDKAVMNAYRLRHAHNPQEALNVLNAVADKATTSGAFYAERAADYIDLKNLEAARKDCETAIKLDKKLSDAYDRRAYCHAMANELDLAIADYSTAIKLNPKSAMPYHNRAIAYRSMGKLAEAKADMEKYLALKPARTAQKEHEELVQRAQTMENSGSPQQAITYLQHQIKAAPSASLYLHLGSLQAKSGHREEALKSYTSAIALSKKEQGPPVGRMALLSKAAVEADLKKFKEAVADCTTVISQASANEPVSAFKTEAKSEMNRALLIRAACYKNLKQYDKALADLNQAGKLAPETSTAIKLRADVHAASGKNLDQAIKDYTLALKQNPGEESALMGRADCYSQSKKYKEALADYSAVIEKTPQAAREAYLGRAKVYKLLNDNNRAQADLDRASRAQAE